MTSRNKLRNQYINRKRLEAAVRGAAPIYPTLKLKWPNMYESRRHIDGVSIRVSP